MSYEDTVVAFQNKFRTEWLVGPFSDKISYLENEETEDTSRDNDPWLIMSFSPEFGGQVTMDATINDATSRYSGIVFFNVFVRGGIGIQLATQVGEFVKEIFRTQQFSRGSSGNITTKRPLSEPLGNDESGWYQYRVQVPYFRDVVETPPNYIMTESSVFITTESESLMVI